MATPTRTLRLKPRLRDEIERIARRSRRSFSEVTQDLLDEALRMRACPGIYFADEPTGREAKVGGTGLGVWEVIRDDATSALDVGNVQLSDRAQLRHAASDGRCLVTRNVRHVTQLAGDAVRREEPHAGIVLCPPSLRGSEIGLIAERLAHLAARRPRGLGGYDVLYLA